MTPWQRAAIRLGCILLIAYLGLTAVFALLQRKLIYLPTRQTENAALTIGARLALEPWRDRDGLIGWKRSGRTHSSAAHRLMVFHGNAGFALHRAPYLEALEALDGARQWEVYLFEYPGYGARPGSPSEEEITRCALAAFDALASSDSRPIYLLGESIGSGPACALAKARPEKVAGLLLVTPLSTLAEVAAHHYPLFPIRLLLREHWDNVAALRDYRGRLAVLLAGEDEVVPTRFGRKLYDGFHGPKQLWIQPHASHNTLDLSPSASWWREVSHFLLRDRVSRNE